MSTPSAEQSIRPRRTDVGLYNGDHMDQKTFHRLYEQTPEGFKAELIGGIVYVASPTSYRHGRGHSRVVGWLVNYVGRTPGTETVDNTTNILDENSEPQPDACLLILPEHGGQARFDEDGYIEGPAELVAEVANTSATIDLNKKLRVYEKAGVKEYVVILAATQTVRWFVRGRAGFGEMKPAADTIFRSKAFPGLWLDPAALFERSPARPLMVLETGTSTPEHAAFVAKLEARAAKRKPKRTT